MALRQVECKERSDQETGLEAVDDNNKEVSPPQEFPADFKQAESKKPYSIYTLPEKWFIVSMASLAALFSPLTANIYLPAIPIIAAAFDKPIELINLSVTVYMVLQALSPMIWGLLADRLGRRPIFLACLLVLSAACIGLALVPTSDYWLLLLLRCVQAAGSASTVALGAGVIGDIATRAERGGFFGFFTLGPLFGPAFGPVIGGALAQTLGWRWIFWVLCMLSAACFLVMAIFFPETLRRLVGDGSIEPLRIYRPVISIVGAGRQSAASETPSSSTSFSNPLRILTYPDVINLLIFNGIQYSVFYAVTTTVSTLFRSAYPFLNETDTGLCYLAIGGGTIIGSLITGKLLDRDFKVMKERMAQQAPRDSENAGASEQLAGDENNFPIEQVRMRMVPFCLIIYVVCCAGYGWCLEKRVNMAAPLVLQIVFSIMAIGLLNTVQTLLVDLLPSRGSSVTACNNLVRCSLGAATVSVIEIIAKNLGIGWTYVLLAGISFVTSPMIWLAVRMGPRCRSERRAKVLIRTS